MLRHPPHSIHGHRCNCAYHGHVIYQAATTARDPMLAPGRMVAPPPTQTSGSTLSRSLQQPYQPMMEKAGHRERAEVRTSELVTEQIIGFSKWIEAWIYGTRAMRPIK